MRIFNGKFVLIVQFEYLSGFNSESPPMNNIASVKDQTLKTAFLVFQDSTFLQDGIKVSIGLNRSFISF